MKILGIEFDPWNEPLSRRLETFVIAIIYFVFIAGAPLFLFIAGYLILCTRVWWLMLLYIIWIYLDRETCEKGGRPSKWVQQWTFWKVGLRYWPLHLAVIPGAAFNPKKNYLFCYFPHGILPAGSFGAFLTDTKKYNETFPEHQARLATIPLFYQVPFGREMALSIGGISCSPKSLNYVLTKPEGGHIVILSVGGAAESYNAQPGIFKINLKNRKGFIKMALKSGSPLVPVFAYGETDLFKQVTGPRLHKIQEFLRRLTGVAPVIFNGRGLLQNSFGIVPRREKITVLVGKPIEFEQTDQPTQRQIDELHQKFTTDLKNLFEEHKHKYLKDPENKFLEIV